MSIAKQPTTESSPTRTRYKVLLWLCLVATIAYVGRNCLGVAAGQVRRELDISLTSMGWVMSAFFWGYALAQIPSGWLCHRWGVRRALPTFALIWSLSCAALGSAVGFWSLVVFQLLFGIAQAGVFPCSAASISQWQPVARRAFASGSLASFMSIGGALGASLTGLALSGVEWSGISISPLSWRWVFVAFGFPGALWAAGFYGWYRNRPEQHGAVNGAELQLIRNASVQAAGKPSKAPASVPWSLVFASFDIWMICGQQFFRAAGYIFFATWFPTFLKQTRGVTTAASGYLTALPLLGVVAGGVLGGLLVDFLWNRTHNKRISRQAVAIAAMLSCAAFIGGAYFVASASLAVGLITAGSFSAALGGSCGYTVTIEKAGRHVAPIFGLMNMSGNLGAAICPAVIPLLVKWLDWEPVLIFFAGIYVAAAVCWALLNPNGTLEET